MLDAARLGRSLRAIRIRLGLRQEDVASRAGVSRSFVSKVELGRASSSDFSLLDRVCRAVGADLDLRVRWRGEGLDRLLDEGHAALVDAVVALLPAADWEVALEVTFNEYGDRGSIDVFAWHAARRAVLVVEVKSVVADAQGTLSPLDRKVRLGARLARARGWEPTAVSRLLVVEDGPTNRRRLARFESMFAAALPSRNRAVRRWIAEPVGRIDGLLFLSYATRGGTRRTTAGRTRVRRRREAPGPSQVPSTEVTSHVPAVLTGRLPPPSAPNDTGGVI